MQTETNIKFAEILEAAKNAAISLKSVSIYVSGIHITAQNITGAHELEMQVPKELCAYEYFYSRFTELANIKLPEDAK